MSLSTPVIGIDLDNTLISYDSLFHKLALEQGLIQPDLPVDKTTVRDFLRRAGKEPEWTALQGLAYGARIREAEPFPGALDFLREGKRRAWKMYIVSHKTKQPIAGEPIDLHEAARSWLNSQSVHGEIGFSREDVWFEETKTAKIQRICELKCDVFIDDLPELLFNPQFPSQTRRILFSPQGLSPKAASENMTVVKSWAEITRLLSHEFI